MFVNKPFVRLPITFLLFETSIITTMSGGARTPLITAVQKSAVTGGIFRKLISTPINVETGVESNGHTEIANGVRAGDSVVVSGQFLIDSEANLKSTISRMGESANDAQRDAGHGAQQRAE